jgi:hypothetical protein
MNRTLQELKEPNETNPMTNLSPDAQEVLDAALFEVNAECDARWIAAAVLRAAAKECAYPDDYGVDYITPEQLLAIATELEGTN